MKKIWRFLAVQIIVTVIFGGLLFSGIIDLSRLKFSVWYFIFFGGWFIGLPTQMPKILKGISRNSLYSKLLFSIAMFTSAITLARCYTLEDGTVSRIFLLLFSSITVCIIADDYAELTGLPRMAVVLTSGCQFAYVSCYLLWLS